MTETIRLGEIVINVTRKPVKHTHLSVHPPSGRVTLVTPMDTRLEVARAYASSRLGWIRGHQLRMQAQARELPRQFVTRESHYLWGRRYLLVVVEDNKKPWVNVDHRTITVSVRPGSDRAKRQEVIHAWHKSLLHEAIPPLIHKWETILGVKVSRYFLQRMKTKWGGCNHCSKAIRLNTELVKKPRDLLEYVVIHEVLHLIEPTHSKRFISLVSRHHPTWREARLELNELPLASEVWNDETMDKISA